MNFQEKPDGDGAWINGGFFVLNHEIFKYLPEISDDIMWEESPLNDLTRDNQLVTYKHNGFWKCMDAMRDKIELEQLWETNKAQWRTW